LKLSRSFRIVPPALVAVALLLTGCAGRSAEPSRRVFLIGLDGATWDLVDPLMAAGRMPHLAALVAEGSRAELRSLIPTKSPALWTTVATGKNFEKHGINDFTEVAFDDGATNMKVMHMTSNMRTTKALWNIVGADAGRSAFVGWWVSYPAEEVEGYVVSSRVPLSQSGGKDAPTKGVLTADGVGAQTWPRGLYEEILPLIRPAESVTFDEAARFMDLREDELALDIVEGFRWAYAADETYLAVAEHLLAKDPGIALWGLYFNGIDVVSHRYWKYLEPSRYRDVDPAEIPRFRAVIERYYEYTDGVLGRLLEQRRPGDTIVVVSDHGFHAYGHKDGPAGVLVIAGENVTAGVTEEDAELADITPTVLALLGMPAGEDMDGRVLEELFTPEWRSSYPADRIASYDTPDWLAARDRTPVPSDADEELLERLEALGYMN
jgi:predicted AlkP superfamily phosphohydrolase/phosphomutase